MSDVSVLSHEYKRIAELSQAINQSLITLKKAQLGIQGARQIPRQDIDAAAHLLAETAEALVSLLGPTGGRELKGTVVMRVPGELVERIRTVHSGDLVYYLEDLRGAAVRSRQAATALKKDDFLVLDQLAALADAQASRVFRRLMRK